MKRTVAAIALALVVLLPNSSRGMAIFAYPGDAASNQDSWEWRHEGVGPDSRTGSSPLPPNCPAGLTADSDWETALARAAKTTDGSTGGPAPAAGRIWRLPEPATIAIWSSLGLLLGLRVWRQRRRGAAGGGADAFPPLASHRRPWSSQQRLAIQRTIQRGCRQEFDTGSV